MSTAKKLSGLALATAAAGLFLAVGAMSPAMGAAHTEGKVKCEGVNACKGQSECKTANSNCKGLNGCKGQGFQSLSQKDCDAAKAKMKK